MVLSSQIRFAHTEAFLNVKKCKIEHSRHNTLEIESNRMGPVESNRMGPVESNRMGPVESNRMGPVMSRS